MLILLMLAKVISLISSNQCKRKDLPITQLYLDHEKLTPFLSPLMGAMDRCLQLFISLMHVITNYNMVGALGAGSASLPYVTPWVLAQKSAS